MGTYITHEGLPFHGPLKKIRIRSCRATDPSLPGFDEEQLLEITRDGTVKLTQKTPSGTEKAKTRISQADTDFVFAAFSEVFASYRKERIPSVSGHWRVRLLTDDNEVYFYHGANGQEYRYHDEPLTDILRQRTGMPGLFGLSVKTETKSKVKSIEISLEQTAADKVKDRYANECGICIHDTNEWLLVSSEGTITYNRRIARVGRVSLQYELKDKVAEFLKVCGDPERRNGIVLTASYPAKWMGVKTGMPLWEAQQHCRDIIFVPAHYDLYTRYSSYTREIFLRFTDQVEPFGLDEAWLDCTASQSLFGTGEKIAKKISDTVKDELGITCSVGVSWNKVFAKLGSDYKKPDAITVISRSNWKDIVFPLPATDLLYVGSRTGKNCQTIAFIQSGIWQPPIRIF